MLRRDWARRGSSWEWAGSRFEVTAGGCSSRGSAALRRLLWPGHITLSEARLRLDQRRFSRPNTHFSAFFEIYKILQNFCKFFEIFRIFPEFCKFWGNLQKYVKFCKKFCKICAKFNRNLQNLFARR